VSSSPRPARRPAPSRTVFTFLVAFALLLAAWWTIASYAAPSPIAVAATTTPTTTATPVPSPSPAPAFPATLTDDEGTAVAIPAEPQKIVSLTPAATETLFALGAGPRVIATTDFDDYPPAAVKLPHVASYTSVDVEKIVGMAADLVIAGGNSFNPPEAITRLRGLGIPVLVVYAPNVATVLKDIRLIGSAVGLADAAATMSNRGRHPLPVIEDGRIIEDHAATDTMELVRQLGVWRLVLLAAKHPRLVLRRG